MNVSISNLRKSKTPRRESEAENLPVPQLSVDGYAKLVAVSPFKTATPQVILAFIAAQSKALIVLPGGADNTPSPRDVQRVVERGSAVFIEGRMNKLEGRQPQIVTKAGLYKMPPPVFSRRPSAAQINTLAERLPGRTINIGSRKATFFLCGELIAFNPNGTVKHDRTFDYDVIINPGHTLMGHWNHLGEKLKHLSMGSIAVYVTNNTKSRHLTSDVRIYKDGKLLDRTAGENIAWSESAL